MTKKIKQFKDSFNEEKARVRLYKSGKNWIKAGIKEIQLLRVMGLPFNGQKITDKEDVNANNNSNNMKKNISKASAVIGGAFTFNMLNDHQAFAASETPVTSEISSNSTTVGDQTSTKESRDSAASTESKDSAASTESKDSAASTESKDSAASTDFGSTVATNDSNSSSNSTSAINLRTFSRLATTTFAAAAATSTTNTYTGAGTDTNYNIPIYYKLTTVNNGTSMTFTYTVTYDNPATTTVERPTALSNSYAIYNTGTTNQTMFTLGSAYGTPSTATSYITDSTGAQVSNPRANTTNINKQGSGYTWANGYQMNGAQAKQGYGLTTTWTVPINSSGDTSFTFNPYSTSVTGGTNFFNGQKVTVTDPTSASTSTANSQSASTSTANSQSASTSTANSQSASDSTSVSASDSASTSASDSTSASASDSASVSASDSASVSASDSSSSSACDSASVSASDSSSVSASDSASVSASDSA
ncbi:KxYKxGKxW signal peptide domain-containing protein, partial [Staphylococcus epidermidis]|uniref:KxYKxGKxW signal peptide domain-containing protein n=1 Tax=Staphylococcus epidermidis TaxID=1282 RepID=UPI0018889845